MRVPYSYLEEQFRSPEKILESVGDLVRRGDFTLGEEVEKFESAFSALTGAPYAIGVSSGTAALFLGLQALGIGRGREVITTPNTFFATANAIAAVGAEPVFVDVGPDYNINPDLIEGAITVRTRAIMPVHLTGNPANMNRIMEIARRYDLKVVEDAAQAIGARLGGAHVGNFGNVGGFSLHPLKNLNVWGDAGVAVTNDYGIAERMKVLRNQGLSDRDTWATYGHNLRIASLQALVGNHLIGDTEEITKGRIANAERYDSLLSDVKEVAVPERLPGVKQVFHTYVIQADNRDGLLKHLEGNGIEAKVHYPKPLHLQPAAMDLGYSKGDFPVAESQAKRILSLPVHQHLTDEQVNYAAEKVREFYN